MCKQISTCGRTFYRVFLLVGLGLLLDPLAGRCQDMEQAPINYSRGPSDNCITHLEAKLKGKDFQLRYDDDHGYLKAVLEELQVPLSSQVLVFSKTSLQRHRIGPKTPRAIYFNDDVYVGFCWRGDVLEISAVDPNLGTAYYTLDQVPDRQPRFVRQTDNCLICHGGSLTRGYPGHLVRSVFSDPEGTPVLSLGSVRVDHRTPFAERWGGWYVTGTSGKQSHRGNLVVSPRTQDPPRDNPEGVNVTDLRFRFLVANYLTPHSDLVALMVLEHQVELHNRITQASFETRRALYQQAEFDRILERKADGLSESTRRRIQSSCEPLVRYLLFCEETPLREPIAGTSKFTAEFAARGPRDSKGRSFREFDLKTRLFKYPCSYLIHSTAFQRLPREAKEQVYSRLAEILSEHYVDPEFAHLSMADRRAIRAILRDTIPELAREWETR